MQEREGLIEFDTVSNKPENLEVSLIKMANSYASSGLLPPQKRDGEKAREREREREGEREREDRKSTRLNSSHKHRSRMPSSA